MFLENVTERKTVPIAFSKNVIGRTDLLITKLKNVTES